MSWAVRLCCFILCLVILGSCATKENDSYGIIELQIQNLD